MQNVKYFLCLLYGSLLVDLDLVLWSAMQSQRYSSSCLVWSHDSSHKGNTLVKSCGFAITLEKSYGFAIAPRSIFCLPENFRHLGIDG
jgi:hypothetical protein